MADHKNDTSSSSSPSLTATGVASDVESLSSFRSGGKNGVPHIPLGHASSGRLDPTDHHTISPTTTSHKAARPLPIEETSKQVREGERGG